MIIEMTELDELLAQGVDSTVNDFIQRFFVRFIERGMSEEEASQTIIELCDEFFGFWQFYQTD
jgi:hypothetical protein